MLDMKFLRENPELVKENIKKKFQDSKLPLVDEVIELDAKSRKAKQEADALRAERNKISKQIGALMAQGKKEEAEQTKKLVTEKGELLASLEAKEAEYAEKIYKIMLVIPNMIDESVPVGRDDSENVEVEKFGEPTVPDFEIPLLASALNVGDIITAEQFEGKTRTTEDNKTKKLLGIIANLNDYSLGATKGGEVTHFTQFDIDFNQEKSLLETRCSGALTRVYSAIAIEEPAVDTTVAG